MHPASSSQLLQVRPQKKKCRLGIVNISRSGDAHAMREGRGIANVKTGEQGAFVFAHCSKHLVPLFFFFHCFLWALEAMVVFWGTCTNLLILRYCVRSAVLCKRAGLVTHLKLVLEPSRALCSTVKPWYNEAKWRFYWLASMPGPVHSWQQELLPLHSMCVPRQQYVQAGGRSPWESFNDAQWCVDTIYCAVDLKATLWTQRCTMRLFYMLINRQTREASALSQCDLSLSGPSQWRGTRHCVWSTRHCEAPVTVCVRCLTMF